MDGLEGKLGKVSESVEQVMTDVKDMKGKMMTTEHFQSIEELLKRIQSASLDQRDSPPPSPRNFAAVQRP